ncbi:aminoglycoside phosphotransferase family protein [Metabacillus malikii]|uniref:Streptomycin 6-kinase n=1 Tax=Metabacillus malikii TaxID=1504265 RepID=A0ABT9ZE46_9BACI|nr:aminoglycoside phosphotransferase family protein [Metabacillus malikii]MDQ0230122.1 streptomycin 6-kinase [Metabacillus malikii]
MSSSYCFRESEENTIINRFGQQFYNKVCNNINHFRNQWSLHSLKLIQSFSANLVFTCYSERFGDAVLKIGSSPDITKEYFTLKHYQDNNFCQIFAEDLNQGAILEQWVKPGTPLRAEQNLTNRLSVFSNLYKCLHKPHSNKAIFPTYTQWVTRITDYIASRDDCRVLSVYMNKAQEICFSITNFYSQEAMLHGDLHHDNILLGNNGQYVIIDPKGVVGDPIFDIPRFILNEFGDEKDVKAYQKISNIINTFEKNLKISKETLRQCLYIETVMAACWDVESGKNVVNVMGNVEFAKAILEGV